MKVQATCTYKSTRQGSGLDENDQVQLTAVADLRFTLMPNISAGSDNRETFAHLPGGEFSLTGVKAALCENVELGDIFSLEFTKVS